MFLLVFSVIFGEIPATECAQIPFNLGRLPDRIEQDAVQVLHFISFSSINLLLN